MMENCPVDLGRTFRGMFLVFQPSVGYIGSVYIGSCLTMDRNYFGISRVLHMKYVIH